MIQAGLLLINSVDIYTDYGAFLSEEKESDNKNYDSLLKSPKIKEIKGVEYKDKHGVDYPEKLQIKVEEREIELRFTIIADSLKSYLSKYNAFIAFLREGNSGWLNISLTDADISLKVFMMDTPEYTQYTITGGAVAGSFKIKFKEPKPIADNGSI